jgi:anti-sigma regulatory factor (Ser/Thr protein kinase)
MTPAPQIAVSVTEPTQAGEARRVAARLAENIGFDERIGGEAAIVATELAANLARYAREGVLLIQTLDLPAGPTLEILSIDAGPGMTDVSACLRDGYSTGGTPGNGLGAVRRLSSEFDIYSTPAGTVIMSRIRRSAPAARAATPPSTVLAGWDWAAISRPAPHEVVCGDAWRIAVHAQGVVVMVCDGLGHGPHAAEAAGRAVAVFEACPQEDAAAMIEQAHRALNGSRGAAMAVATLGASGLRYAGVGNIAGVLTGGERSRGLPSQNGTVGVQIRRVQVLDYDWPSAGRLFMHSDGLTSRWTLERYPGLASRHPAIQAGVLWRDCARGRDDATIVVVGRRIAGHA